MSAIEASLVALISVESQLERAWCRSAPCARPALAPVSIAGAGYGN